MLLSKKTAADLTLSQTDSTVKTPVTGIRKRMIGKEQKAESALIAK